VKTPVRVLLVEDEELVQRITTKLLISLGCTVDVAQNGKQALEKNFNTYDLILMDIGLPDMDGTEVTKIIRESFSACDLPIIALTAHVQSHYRQQCLSVGMNHVLNKPAAKSELNQIITRYVPKHAIV